MLLNQFERQTKFLFIFLCSGFQAVECELVVSPVEATEVRWVTGTNVTLNVSFTGAPDPAVTWFMDSLPVVTWTIGSDKTPDVAEEHRHVLVIERDGSLTLVHVPVRYTSNYTVRMTKSGLGTSSTSFSLKVYEMIQDLLLSSVPDPPQEGPEQFTLQYSFTKGVVDEVSWFFDGAEIKSNSHYSVERESLVVLNPNRTDTGEYAVSLSNPFSHVTAKKNITLSYGPDDPIIHVHPPELFHVSGDSLNLSCKADGFPEPTADWVFAGEIQPDADRGLLGLVDVRIDQAGVYKCTLRNELTDVRRQGEVTLLIYEKPTGEPVCSVHSENSATLAFRCRWPGGTPSAQLSFPALSDTMSGGGDFTLNVNASDSLDGKATICTADHPVEKKKCNVTASSPVKFIPRVRTVVEDGGKIEVSITCLSEASPRAEVTWFKGTEAVSNNDTIYQINGDATELKIRDHNVSTLVQHTYTCSCRNSLGVQSRDIRLQGPAISDSSLIKNPEGFVVTLTWEVPANAIVTGFDIQIKGPELQSENLNNSQRVKSSDDYRTIQQRPGHVRSTDILNIDPKSLYFFRVIPRALMIEGEPSKVHRNNRATGLSGPAIAGIAAGIPCSLLFLLLSSGLVYLCYSCWKNKSQHIPYPVSRSPEIAKTKPTVSSPPPMLNGGLKSPPDYNRLHHVPSERSMALPTFVPPPPFRVATTV